MAAGLGLGCTAALKESSLKIENVISRVTDVSGNIVAVLQTGAPPAPSGGPAAAVTGIPAMVNGGSAQQTVSGTGSFVTVIVAVAGFSNYYELTLPSSASSGVVIGAAAVLSGGTITMQYAVGSGGVLGTYANQLMRIIRVGTGDIQVSVSWDSLTDVDLHVVDPNNAEVFYGNPTVASGGTLDLDANAACNIDAPLKNNENIVWPATKAIPGSYTVRLDYWSACTRVQTNYLVTVAVKGQTPQIFSGTFISTDADGGGAGSGRFITAFTFP
ncbi:MAG: YfaP family protein [Gemmatimonadales bacterium]